jgi:hypothetical protein
MAEDPKQGGGDLNPLALAGGIPAAENLAASYGMLTNISSTLLGIMKNPLISAEGVQQLSRRWDEHVIKKLKEMHNLTGKQAEAFDKLARSGEGVRSMFSRMEGFAMGAGLRIAYLNEQLERQAATVGKYARLQDLSGGSAFGEARRMQAQYYGNVATYGKDMANQMKQAEMQLNTAMFSASGIRDAKSRSNFSAGMGMYNQMYGGNAGGFVASLASKFGSRGMTLGKGQDLLEQLRGRLEGGQIYNERGLEGIQQEFLQLATGLGKSGMGYSSGRNLSGAANLMQMASGNKDRKVGQEDRQYIYKMMSDVMMSGSQTALMVGAGLGKSPMQVAREAQQRMGEDPRAVMLDVSKGVKSLIDRAGGLKSTSGRYFAEKMGMGDLDQIEFLTETLPKILDPIQAMNVNYKDLNNKGRIVGKEMQDRAEASKDAQDVVSGTLGKWGTNISATLGKEVGYGISLASLAFMLRSMGKRGGLGKGGAMLFGAGALQKMINSPDVQGAGGNVGGGADLDKVTDVISNAVMMKSLLGTKGASMVAEKAPTLLRLSKIALAGKASSLALVFESGFSVGLGAIAGTSAIVAGAAVLGYLADKNYHENYAKEYSQGVLSNRIQNNMEGVSARPVQESFEKMWMGQNKPQAWLDNLVTGTDTTGSKKGAIEALGIGEAQKLNIDPYGNALPAQEGEESGAGGGGNTTVTIQIVGQNGENLGSTIVEQNKQATIRLSAGQVLGVN